jgi:hypothetical protein
MYERRCVAMTLILELPPELESQLKSQAERRGLDPQAYVRRLMEADLPDVPVEIEAQKHLNQSTLDLFAKWESEDAIDDPEELARRQQDWEELKAAMNETREQAGARKLFP